MNQKYNPSTGLYEESDYANAYASYNPVVGLQQDPNPTPKVATSPAPPPLRPLSTAPALPSPANATPSTEIIKKARVLPWIGIIGIAIILYPQLKRSFRQIARW